MQFPAAILPITLAITGIDIPKPTGNGLTLTYKYNDGQEFTVTDLTSEQCYAVETPGVVPAGGSSVEGGRCWLYSTNDCSGGGDVWVYERVPNEDDITLGSYGCIVQDEN